MWYDDWRETYDQRLDTWLYVMENAEAPIPKPTSLTVPLYRYMRESWETGRLFLSYGARTSWAFDPMYWNILDERFFDDRDNGVRKNGFVEN